MPDSLLAAARTMTDRLRGWRRYLHANPELSGQERATADFLATALRQLGYEPVERVGGTFGLTATLQVSDAPAVALRADMDALPIREETGLDFASQNAGVMHACGHDAHMAMLLGAAALLKQRQAEAPRSVRLIFQPQEELPPGGAAALIAAGVLDNVESVFGLHVWSKLPLGTLATRCGPFMSSADNLRITIRGQGGHAAMPEECVDPIVVAAEVVTSLQTVVSRSIAMADHAVVSVTKIEAGSAYNVIPESATLLGTIRTLSEAVRARVGRRVRDLVEGIARAHEATAEVQLLVGYPVLINDEGVVRRAFDAARKVGFAEEQLQSISPQGSGEDFAHYGRKVPAAFMFLGAGDEAGEGVFPHHHPRFTIHEEVLPLGAALLAQYALDAGAA